MQEISDRSAENKPLRRRAGILIGQWVSKLKPADRPAAYRALLSLLGDDDFATALAGVGALHELVSDWDFVEEPFLEFVSPCLQLLAAMLHAAELYDSQRQVGNTTALLVRLAPYLPCPCNSQFLPCLTDTAALPASNAQLHTQHLAQNVRHQNKKRIQNQNV